MTATLDAQIGSLTNDDAVFNPSEAERFGDRLVGALNETGLALLLSLGHRTGLFDVMASLPAATSGEIAEAAGLNERYVREWLNGLVAARVLAYEPQERRYRLPASYAALLTRDSKLGNFAATMQWIAVLASVETRIVERFKQGGGVHYHEFHRFHECMAEESAQTVVAGLREHILPLVPGLTERLEEGIDVLDVGCGSGRAICALADWFPNSRFTGFDLCPEAIDAARAEAAEKGLRNVRFTTRDAANLGERAAFDLVTGFDVVHDQRDPVAVLNQIYAALRPGGTFLMQDIRASSYPEKNADHALGAFLYTISTMHCMTVSLAQGGAGLGTCWGEELAVKMLEETGFKDIRVQQLEHDILNNWYTMTR